MSIDRVYNLDNNYYKHLQPKDKIIIKNVFTILLDENIDLTGKILWIFNKSNFQLDKDYKFTKYLGNLIHLHKYKIYGKKSYISNTIINRNDYIIWYRDNYTEIEKMKKLISLKNIELGIIDSIE